MNKSNLYIATFGCLLVYLFSSYSAVFGTLTENEKYKINEKIERDANLPNNININIDKLNSITNLKNIKN